MSRRRFFVPEIYRGIATLTGQDAEHLVRVLRAEPGQVYEISDNQDVYLAVIETARKSAVSFRVKEKLTRPADAVSITLAAALFKFDRFEWLLEKAIELGVAAIQPLEAGRTEKGLARAAQKRYARWERIALEASQQSRRAHLPRIQPVHRFAEALQLEASTKLMLDEADAAPAILGCLPERKAVTDDVALLLGPEGGWTHEERQKAQAAGWIACSLGKTILRAETAGIAGLAILQAAWGQPTSASERQPPLPACHPQQPE